MIFSGVSPDGKLMEIVELPKDKHPFFLGTQFHPEFKARPLHPHPIFTAFIEVVGAAKGNQLLFGSNKPEDVVRASPIYAQVLSEYATIDALHRFRVYRVAAPNDNSGQFLGIDDFAGYNPLTPSRNVNYQEAMANNNPLIDLAGIKYLPCDFGDFRNRAQKKALDYCANETYLPRAFLVSSVSYAQNDTEALAAVQRIEITHVAVIEDAERRISNYQSGALVLSDYRPGFAKFKTQSDTEQLLVFTESFYPGWKGFIDSGPAKIYRADYLFQGIFIPSGSHEIIFQYEPRKFYAGLAISLATLLFVIVGFVVTLPRSGGLKKQVVA